MRKLLEGPGVHGGRPCRLEIGLRSGGPRRPEFRFPGLPFPMAIGELARLPRIARRATVLGFPDPAYPAGEGPFRPAVETPEHLLAALLFFPDAPLTLAVDAAELPGLDGSALPFRDALAGLLPEAARLPAWREYPCAVEWEEHWPGGFIRIRPAERFSVSYELERGSLRQAHTLESAVDAWNGILPARTFAFHEDWLAATASGLMAGAGPASGLLLAGSEAEYREVLARRPEWAGGPYPLLNLPDWRMPDEPVRHKILDLLGDLALGGLALPRASIEVRNGGHASHHRLLARLSDAGGRPEEC